MDIIAKDGKKQDEFIYIDLDDKTLVGYSKTTTSLPLTQFRLEGDTPCLDDGSTFSHPDGYQATVV